MRGKGIPQEWLKGLACLTMLIDHIGAALVSGDGCRIVGRVAFPIFCFLLAEGIAHTRDPRKYGIRLLLGAVLAELPFDLLLFGGPTWQHQSVMVTLLLGFLYGVNAEKIGKVWLRVLFLLPFLIIAEWMGTDYGGYGVAMIALFVLTRKTEGKLLLQTGGLALICWAMDSYRVGFWGLRVPIELFAVAAMVPIAAYSGKKCSTSRWVQWGFYLFYPVHLTMLLFVRGI